MPLLSSAKQRRPTKSIRLRIVLKVKQEFAAKEKARAVKKGPETEKQKKKQAA